MATVKQSISFDEDLLARAKDAAGPGGLSAFVNDAVRLAVQHQRLAEWVDEDPPVDERDVQRLVDSWPRAR